MSSSSDPRRPRARALATSRALVSPALILLLTAAMLAAALLLPRLALAGGSDFAAEAKARMNLDFDLDEVEMMLEAPQPSPAARQLAALGYVDPGYRPPPSLPLEPNSQMTAVTVFRDRALVTRGLEHELDAGPGAVTFEGLPLGLSPESLNAFVASGPARIVGLELVSGQGEVEDTERIQGIRDQARELTEQLGQVRDRIEALLMQRAYLRNTLLGTVGSDVPPPSLDQVKGTLVFVGEAEQDIAARLRAEEEQAEELGEELSPLLIKLENPLATGMQVRVDLDAESAGTVAVGLRYQVHGARWWPSYNARLDDTTSHVTLEYYGLVSQQTGEDWEDVELQLSTADPSTSGELPQLGTWTLGRDATYGAYSVVDNLMVGRGHYQEPGNARAAAEPVPSSEGIVDSDMTAGVRGSGAVVFAIPGQRTVAGDGSQQRLPVGSQTFTAVQELATVPKLMPEVFRQARLRYEGQVPLLPGAVSTYTGGDFLGSGSLDSVLPGEELLLSFGIDESVKVKRQLVSRQQEALGMGKKTVRWTFHFRIAVANYGDAARVVRVADQLPVSEVDEVKVKLEETTPADPAEEADGPGIMKWTLNLQPGEEQVIDLRFSVTAPTDAAAASYLATQLF